MVYIPTVICMLALYCKCIIIHIINILGYIVIVFDPLWKTLKENGVSQYALIKKYGVSPAQITRLKHNKYVSTHTLDMMCKILDCGIEDILEYRNNEQA